jgi:hypothetical protein
MNVYRYRTPKVPDAIAQNISIRLRGVINGSDFTETQGAALIDICEECWKSGWQNGHFLMNQTGPQEETIYDDIDCHPNYNAKTDTIDGHLEAVYEEMSSQESYGGTD